MKKGQTEIIGLVIVVILITLGMLFIAQFSLKERSEKKIFTRKGLAYSSMSAILRTTVAEGDCIGSYRPTMEEVLVDCAKYYSLDLSIDSLYQCQYPTQTNQRRHSCIFFKDAVTDLLGKTLGSWNKHYEFRTWIIPSPTASAEDTTNLFGPEGERGTIQEEGCPGERDVSGLQPIQAGNAGLLENEIYICD